MGWVAKSHSEMLVRDHGRIREIAFRAKHKKKKANCQSDQNDDTLGRDWAGPEVQNRLSQSDSHGQRVCSQTGWDLCQITNQWNPNPQRYILWNDVAKWKRRGYGLCGILRPETPQLLSLCKKKQETPPLALLFPWRNEWIRQAPRPALNEFHQPPRAVRHQQLFKRWGGCNNIPMSPRNQRC